MHVIPPLLCPKPTPQSQSREARSGQEGLGFRVWFGVWGLGYRPLERPYGESQASLCLGDERACLAPLCADEGGRRQRHCRITARRCGLTMLRQLTTGAPLSHSRGLSSAGWLHTACDLQQATDIMQHARGLSSAGCVKRHSERESRGRGSERDGRTSAAWVERIRMGQ
jgi:hypothetical protein